MTRPTVPVARDATGGETRTCDLKEVLTPMEKPKVFVEGRNVLAAGPSPKPACSTGASVVARRSKRRAPVRGSAELLRSHLRERLLPEGHHPVACTDNPNVGTLENTAHLQDGPNFEYTDRDASSYTNIPGELDEMYRFPSPASPKDLSRTPIPILKAGASGTHNTLGAALAKGARLTLASSGVAYGDRSVHPRPQDYSKRCRLHMTRAKETSGWERRVSAREGSRRPSNRLFAGRGGREVS